MFLILVLGILPAFSGLQGIGKEVAVLPFDTLNPKVVIGALSDFQITPEGGLVLLDRTVGQVIETDSQGKITNRYGQLGPGPEELGKVSLFALLDGTAWIPDVLTGTVKIAKAGTIRGIKLQNVRMPKSAVALGDNVLIGGGSLLDGADLYSADGTFLKHLTPNLPSRPKPVIAGLWNMGVYFKTGKNVAYGFQYDNRLTLFDEEVKEKASVSMDLFYDKIESNEDGAIFPGGYSAWLFSAGPKDSFFIVTCSHKDLTCQELIQVTPNLKGLLGTKELPEKVMQIRYFPDHGLFGILDLNNTLFLYHAD